MAIFRRSLRITIRRHLKNILYHAGLTLLVTGVVLKYGGLSEPQPATSDAGGKELGKRAIMRNFPSGAHASEPAALVAIDDDDRGFVMNGRAADDLFDDAHGGWIKIPDDAIRLDSGHARKFIRDADDADEITPLQGDTIKSLEVLGEGGSARDKLGLNPVRASKNKPHHHASEGDLPISDTLRERLRQEKEAKQGLQRLPETTLLTDERRIKIGKPPALEIVKGKVESVDASRIIAATSKPSEPISVHIESGKVNVLIVAAMRTGSSFLGELFAQRYDFFYMFEPGRLVMHKLDERNLTRGVMTTKLIHMLGKFYRCKFNDMPFFIDILNHDTLRARKQTVPALVSNQFCIFSEFGKGKFRRQKDKCVPVSERALSLACSRRKHAAIKSIRILDINLMLDAVLNPETNLKLIHLVRDPRSMIVSRLKLAYPSVTVFDAARLSDTYRNILLKYCSNWLQNFEIGHYVPQLRNNYLMVRYEDLALDPHGSARKIYGFAGLGADIPSSVLKWIEKNTKTDDQSKQRSAAFSTKRDSKEVLVSWKRRITLEMARAIEEVGACKNLMQATGYKLIGNNMRSLTNNDHLVESLPKPRFGLSAFDFL